MINRNDEDGDSAIIGNGCRKGTAYPVGPFSGVIFDKICDDAIPKRAEGIEFWGTYTDQWALRDSILEAKAPGGSSQRYYLMISYFIISYYESRMNPSRLQGHQNYAHDNQDDPTVYPLRYVQTYKSLAAMAEWVQERGRRLSGLSTIPQTQAQVEADLYRFFPYQSGSINCLLLVKWEFHQCRQKQLYNLHPELGSDSYVKLCSHFMWFVAASSLKDIWYN